MSTLQIQTPTGLRDLTAAEQATIKDALALALQDLGAWAPIVQIVIDDAIQKNNQIISQFVTSVNPAAVKPIDGIDGKSFADLNELAVYLAQKASNGGSGGASTPSVLTAPSISDITVDVGQTDVVVVPGTTSGGTVTDTVYRWIVAGATQLSTWKPGIGSVAQPVGGTAPATAEVLVLEQLVTYAGSLAPLSIKSNPFTLNAGAVVPFNTSAPTATGSQASGNAAINAGLWSNSPLTNGYIYKQYDGGTPAQGGQLMQTLTGQPSSITQALAAYAGKTLVWEIYASNAIGPATTPAYTQPIVVAGGQPPKKNAAIGFVYQPVYRVGDDIRLDYGLQPGTLVGDFWDNNPSATGFQIVMRQGITPIAGGGNNVIVYKAKPSDEGKNINYSAVASNGDGSSSVVYSGSITILPQVGGGTGGGAGVTTNYVGSTKTGVFTTASSTVAIGDVTPPAQSNDLAMLMRANNGPQDWNAPSGATFTIVDAARNLVANAGKCIDLWKRTLTGGEPSVYTNAPVNPEIHGVILSVFRNSDGSACGVIDSGAPTIADTVTAGIGGAPATITIVAPSRSASAAGQKMVIDVWVDCSVGAAFTFDSLPAGFSVVAQEDSTGIGPEWQPMARIVGPVSGTGPQGTKSIRITASAGTIGAIAQSYIVG